MSQLLIAGFTGLTVMGVWAFLALVETVVRVASNIFGNR